MRCLLSCIALEKIIDKISSGCAANGDIAKNCAIECLNPLNWSGRSKLKQINDITKRPRNFRKKTVQDAWDNAKPGKKPNQKACPTCDNEVEVPPGEGARDWDIDHDPKWKDRDLTGLDRKGVLDEYNRDVRLRCPHCNRSDNH
jgi:hypothetical protein